MTRFKKAHATGADNKLRAIPHARCVPHVVRFSPGRPAGRMNFFLLPLFYFRR